MNTENKNSNKNKEEELKILQEVCSKYDVKTNHIQELMELERAHRGLFTTTQYTQRHKR